MLITSNPVPDILSSRDEPVLPYYLRLRGGALTSMPHHTVGISVTIV